MPDLGPTQLLASGRLGRKVAVNRSDKPVYVVEGGEMCCEHTELASAIHAWKLREKADPDYERPSVCDCQNVDGERAPSARVTLSARCPPRPAPSFPQAC